VCRVYLQRLPHTVIVTVEDDGIGFDTAEAEGAGERRGLGLVGIRERVSHLRGTFRLESTPGQGTRLTAELPARVRPSPEEETESPHGAAAVAVSKEFDG
jgi:signal transduction histidine kinase